MSCKMSFPLVLLTFFYSHSVLTAATNSSDILYEIDTLIRVYKNGSVERLSGTEIVPPSFDPRNGVLSKDINTPTVSARLFLPENASAARKLPLLVYFHGGGFSTNSPFSPTYHNHLNSLVAKAHVVAVSVNYRLAPEHPLPTAYQDSWLALKWVFSHSKGNGTETWLNTYADFGRVYIGGDSAGGNIAHNMAIRVGSGKTGHGVILRGMFLNCPHFWGNLRIGDEASNPKGEAWVESIWIHAYPNSTGFDDPASNPAMDPDLSKLGCKKVLIYVAEYDILRYRGWFYKMALTNRKWDGAANVVDVKGEKHIFSVVFPDSRNSKKMLEDLALFLNDEGEVQWELKSSV